MAKEEIRDRPETEELTEFVNIVKKLDPTSFALMQNNANLLLARDELERQSRNAQKQAA